MHTRQLITLLICFVALGASVEAESKKAPPKAPQEPIDRMMAKIRQADPKGLVVKDIRFYDTAAELQIIVSNGFHRAHYQERLQMTQGFAKWWQEINGTPRSKVFLTDGLGNVVAWGSAYSTWVQKP